MLREAQLREQTEDIEEQRMSTLEQTVAELTVLVDKVVEYAEKNGDSAKITVDGEPCTDAEFHLLGEMMWIRFKQADGSSKDSYYFKGGL